MPHDTYRSSPWTGWECGLCRCPWATLLGTLGTLQHLRCRACGMNWTRTVPPEERACADCGAVDSDAIGGMDVSPCDVCGADVCEECRGAVQEPGSAEGDTMDVCDRCAQNAWEPL